MTGEEMCEEDRLAEAPLYTQRLALPLPLPRPTLNREDAQLLTMFMKMKLFFTILHEEQWTPWSSHKSFSHSAPRTKGRIVQRPTHMNTDCTCWKRKISTRLSEPLFGWQGSSRSSRAKHVVAWTVATGHDYTMDTAKSRVTSTVDQFIASSGKQRQWRWITPHGTVYSTTETNLCLPPCVPSVPDDIKPCQSGSFR